MARGGKFAGAQARSVKFAEGGKNWIAGAIKNKGALRSKLGVKGDETIPAGKLAKAKRSSNPTTRRQANLASTLKSFHADGGEIKLAKGGAVCPDCGKRHSGDCGMAAGGVAKIRRGFPGAKKAPQRLRAGGTVRGGGAAIRGTKFSGTY